MTQENKVLPQLSDIQSCYIDTYKHYRKDAKEIEGTLIDIDLVKKIVRKHSESIQKLDNWIIDIYSRIDAENRIPAVRRNQYQDEIHWCYRLGYITHDEYYQTLEYLDTRADWKNSESERLHSVRMAQIAYNQEILRAEKEHKDAIKELFLGSVRFDKNNGLYYYKD